MLIKYVWTEEFNDNLKRLNQHGGINKKVVDRVMTLLADYHEGITPDPIKDVLPLTKHGESRPIIAEIQDPRKLSSCYNLQ